MDFPGVPYHIHLSLKVESVLERVLISGGVAGACLSGMVFALCALGWATPASLIAVVILAALAAWRLPFVVAGRPQAGRYWTLVALAVPFAIVYLVNAAAPEISPDGAGYHLGLVRRYLDHHGFFPITTNFYASFPQGGEMLFLAAYAIGRHSAAALVHCAFLCALPLAIYSYGRRIGQPLAGGVAGLMVFVAPVAGVDGASAYIDIALAFSVFLCFYALEIDCLAIAGLMAGFAFSLKYTGFAAALYLVACLVARRARFAQWARALTPAALLAAPWLVKNWMVVGNPFSPFLNGLFPNPFVDVAFEHSYRAAMRHFNGASLGLATPLDLTVRGGLLQGTIGPIFLLAPLALLALRDPRGRRVLLAGTLCAVPWFFNIGTRFLLPALPCLALALGFVLVRWPRLAIACVVLNAVLCWPWILDRYCDAYAWRITRFPIAAALRLTPEADWLAANAPDIRFARLLEEHAPADAVIYTAQPIMEAYTSRTILLNYTAARNARVEAMLKAPVDPKFAPDSRRRYRVTGPVELSAECDGPAIVWIEREGAPVEAWPIWSGQSRRIEANGSVILSSRRADNARVHVRSQGAEIGFEESPGPTPDLRLAAVREARRLGVTHLAIHDLEALGPAIAAHPAEWSLRPIASAPPLRLYAITTSPPPSPSE